MKKIIKNTFMLLPIIIIFLIIIPFIISPIINDIRLSRFSKQLNNLSLPNDTECIEMEKACGKLNGNGNGMDYFTCMLIKSDLSLNDLNEFYRNQKFKPAKLFSKNDIEIDITRSTECKLESDYIENQDIYFDSLKNESDYSKYYIVMIYDGGYGAGFDLRGN